MIMLEENRRRKSICVTCLLRILESATYSFSLKKSWLPRDMAERRTELQESEETLGLTELYIFLTVTIISWVLQISNKLYILNMQFIFHNNEINL